MKDLKKSKSWAPEGDPISLAYLKSIGITPTQLTIADVLASLQTGLVDTVYNGFYGSIVLQWFTKTRYIANAPFGYAYGAFVLDRKKFSKLPPEYMELVETAALRHFAALLEDTRKSNKDALDVLKDNGLVLVEPDAGDLKELHMYRDMTVGRIVGKAFSRGIYEETLKHLNDARAPAAR